ncbi:MAG: hypothetical protein ABIJ56_09335 [Pseudomonadota bacterium]
MKKIIRKTTLLLAVVSILGCLCLTGCEEDCKEQWDVCVLDSECCSDLTCTGGICVQE